jgi:predicted nucleic acid-binding Zn ribbon protein
MNETKQCLNCKENIEGRIDKKFCSDYCKSNYHYLRNKEKESSLFKKIDKQLKLNRRILRDFNKAGKSTVRAEKIQKEGFNPRFFTHYWKNKKNDVYLFCYEYGFLKRTENGKTKYILVEWQNYME